MSQQTVINRGIGFPGLLGLLFIALKLTGVITWSWWFVLLPLYLPLALVLTFCLGMLLLAGLLGLAGWIMAKIAARRQAKHLAAFEASLRNRENPIEAFAKAHGLQEVEPGVYAGRVCRDRHSPDIHAR